MGFQRVKPGTSEKTVRPDVGANESWLPASEVFGEGIILELNLPWKELFDAVESYRKDDIAVLAMEPDAQKGLVRISGEAKSLDSLVVYLAYLQKIPLLRDIELVNHQIREQDPQQPVRFMLQATWGARS